MTERQFPKGWVDFAVITLLVTATLDAFQGLIALTRREYY